MVTLGFASDMNFMEFTHCSVELQLLKVAFQESVHSKYLKDTNFGSISRKPAAGIKTQNAPGDVRYQCLAVGHAKSTGTEYGFWPKISGVTHTHTQTHKYTNTQIHNQTRAHMHNTTHHTNRHKYINHTHTHKHITYTLTVIGRQYIWFTAPHPPAQASYLNHVPSDSERSREWHVSSLRFALSLSLSLFHSRRGRRDYSSRHWN